MISFWDPVERAYEGADYPGESEWDRCKLAGIQVPGLVQVVVTPKQKIEVRKIHGADGGPTIERGHEAAKVQIMIRLWTPRQWALWQDLFSLIWRLPGRLADKMDKKNLQAGFVVENGRVVSRLDSALATDQKKHGIRIEHPEAQLLGVQAIALEQIGASMVDAGVRQYVISGVQFIEPTVATRKIVPPKNVELRPDFANPRNKIGPPPSETDNLPQMSVDPRSFMSLP